MAIAYVAGAAATGANLITINKPTGSLATHVAYALFLQDATNSGLGVSLAGWTQLNGVVNTPSNGFPTTLLRRVFDGSEASSFQFTANGGSVSEGVIWTYSGVDNTTPEDAIATAATGTTGTIAYPSITSITDNAFILHMCENFNALASQPSGSTRRTTGAAWTTNADRLLAAHGTLSGITSTGGGEYVARTLALRPAGGGGGSAKLFIPSSLNGLGGGGPFFHNRLG